MGRRRFRAFTLIEVLTVIAIIAILVAIIFPVFGRAREQARQTTCMSNMHDIYVAVSLYRQDYEEYPPLLFALPENADGSPWTPGAGSPVPAGRVRNGFLYPAYVRNVEKFYCPNNTTTDQIAVVQALFPPTAGFSGPATFGSHGLDLAPPDTPIHFYAYDSYDISASVSSAGVREVVYSRDWTNAEGRGLPSEQDSPNQLKYPSPPLDQTVLTWCNWHAVSGAGNCPAILASGTARKVPVAEIRNKGWNWAGR